MSVEMKSPMLMIPGPMDVPDEVLKRLSHRVFPHYDAQTRFPEFYHQLTEKMKVVFGLKEGLVFIPNGSGTIAVNMAIASLCTPDDYVLVVDNGGFGAYAEKNLKALGIPYTLVKGKWGKAIDPDAVRTAMDKKRHPFIYMTHNESSTTVVNPIPPIGEIARNFDALLISDSISAVGERAWKYMDSMKNRRVPFILDFQVWKRAFYDQHDNHPQPVTGATTMLYALDWIVDRIIEEGMENRQERFRAAGIRLKKGMAELGFCMSANPDDASPLVTDFYTPGGIDSNIVRNYYLEKHNTMVGYGFAHVDKKTGKNLSFRIAHFGMASNNDSIDHMIEITRQFVAETP